MIARIFTDGGSRGNPGHAALGVVIETTAGVPLYQVGEYVGVTTNNEAEYQAFLRASTWLAQHQAELEQQGIKQLQFFLDSKLVVEQLNRNWKIKEPRMATWAAQCWKQLQLLKTPFTISHIPREQNSAADALVNQALDARSE